MVNSSLKSIQTTSPKDRLKQITDKFNDNVLTLSDLFKWGSGSPQGVVTAIISCLYQDLTNGVLYQKRSDSGKNTGWQIVPNLATYASALDAGLIKVGDDLDIDDNGVLNIDSNLKSNFMLDPHYIPYSVNSGLTSINKVSETEVSFTLTSGGMVCTFPNGKTHTLTTLNNVTGISADGTYDLVIKEEDISNGVVTPKAVLSSTLNETTANGTGGNDGDRNVNTSVRPMYPEEKISGTWTHKEFIKLGKVTKATTLGAPTVYAFNYNWSLKQSLAINGYKVLENGLIIQWGYSGVNHATYITLPIAFPNHFYSVVLSQTYTGSDYGSNMQATPSSLSQILAYNAGGTAGYYIAIGD